MVVSVWDFFIKLSEKLDKFIIKYFDEPLFWLIIFCLLLGIAYYGISKLANK